MDTVGIKVISRNEINRCIKILRKYCKLSIGEIKEAIISNNYVVECSYVKEEGIVNIIKLYKELCDNNIQAQLYEHERITNVEFLENLVETYYEINEENLPSERYVEIIQKGLRETYKNLSKKEIIEYLDCRINKNIADKAESI